MCLRGRKPSRIELKDRIGDLDVFGWNFVQECAAIDDVLLDFVT